MELNELEAKLEELGKILLADDGFFTQMPKEQFDAFGKAITLMARIEATKVLQENKSNMICDMVNGFTAKITPVFVGGEESMPPMMEEPMPPMMEEPMMEYRIGGKCPNCASEPCMCAINAHQEPMVDKPEDMSGDMPMDKPEDVK
tara:strand:- start:1021 stop:1458 length:438 start_codon:yes stop_codon:yes gene_type:complete